MTPSPSGLARLFPAAALIAAMGLPLTACAQDQVVEEAPAAEAVQAPTVEPAAQAKPDEGKPDEATPDEAQADADKPEPEEEAEPEKTPEELAKEAAKKELEKLQQEAQLRSARLQAELAPLNEEKQRIEAELSLLNTKQQEAHAEAKREKEQADFLLQLRLAKMNREMQQMQAQMQQMQTKMQIDQLKLQNETAELMGNNAKLAAQAGVLQAELMLLNTKRDAASIDKDEMQYATQPLKDGVLTITDRRIPMNDGVSWGTAEFVTERIHYFNNLDEKAPIFIVIDTNPGGSVMEGFRIVTAMKNSKAPVHVVVKQFAASMAAVITTLADESYAYPNAVILHHQMSSGMRGNLTQQQESLEEGKEWSDRLAVPVAKKMGVTYDKFVELMYENNSDGDWAEFADKAKELKWVNHVVEEMREASLVTAPVDNRMPDWYFWQGDNPEEQAKQSPAGPRAFTQHELFNSPPQFKVKTDGNGNTYYELPPLSPYDFYFLHDPDGRFRIAK